MRARLALVVAMALLALVASASGAAHAEPEPLLGRVGEARSLVSSLDPDDREATIRTVAGIRRLLPAEETVQTAEGPVVTDLSMVHAHTFALEQAQTAAAREEARERLGAHLASLEAALVPGDAVLASDPELLTSLLIEGPNGEESALSRWLRDVIIALQEWIASLFARIGSSEQATTGFKAVFYTMLGVAALIVCWVAYRVIRALLAGADARRRRAGAPRVASVPVVAAAEGLPADALAYAAAAASEGRFRDAVRALFGGAARMLAERGVVTHTRTRTNAELIADVAALRPALESPLAALARIFEPAWYGHDDPGRAGYERALAAYCVLHDAVEQASAS